MINARITFVLSGFDYFQNGTCQICGIRRRSYLVENHFQTILFGCESSNCFHKIIPERRIQPRSADNQIIAPGICHRFFTVKFCMAVNSKRSGGIGFEIWCVLAPVEHVIGRDVNKYQFVFCTYLCQVFHRQVIDIIRHFCIVLGFIHVGVCSAVNNDLSSVFRHVIVNGFPIGNVQFGHIGKEKLVIRIHGQHA